MKTRRSFFKKSVAGILGGLFFPSANGWAANQGRADQPVVKQPEEFETFFVRENTPITFAITRGVDRVSSISMCIEELIPGSVIPIHKHLEADEYFHITAGTGILTIEEREIPYKPGTSVFIPRNTWHGFKNTGGEKTIFTFGFTPSGFEEYFKKIGTPAGQKFVPRSREERDRIAAEFGMVFK